MLLRLDDLWEKLRVYFDADRAAGTHSDRGSARELKRHRLVRTQRADDGEGAGAILIEVLPSLARVIPFDSIEQWPERIELASPRGRVRTPPERLMIAPPHHSEPHRGGELELRFRQFIDVRGLSLITGANGSGKSALLDFSVRASGRGQSRFNKAAAGAGSGRTLRGYCLCDTNTMGRDGQERFLRPSGVTIAALEFEFPL